MAKNRLPKIDSAISCQNTAITTFLVVIGFQSGHQLRPLRLFTPFSFTSIELTTRLLYFPFFFSFFYGNLHCVFSRASLFWALPILDTNNSIDSCLRGWKGRTAQMELRYSWCKRTKEETDILILVALFRS